MAKNVFVGCKLPNGVLLQIRDAEGHVVSQTRLEGAVRIGTPDLPAPNSLKENGVGITMVDGEFWEAWEKWAKDNKFPPYMAGFIFASDRSAETQSIAKERASDATRMEGLDVNGQDPRLAEFRAAGLEAVKS